MVQEGTLGTVEIFQCFSAELHMEAQCYGNQLVHLIHKNASDCPLKNHDKLSRKAEKDS